MLTVQMCSHACGGQRSPLDALHWPPWCLSGLELTNWMCWISREPRDLLGSTFPVLRLEMCTFKPGFPLGLKSSMLARQVRYTEPLPLPVILDFHKLYVCSDLRESWSHGCEGKGGSCSSETVKSVKIFWASCSRVDGWLLSWRLSFSSLGIIIVCLRICISSSPCLPMLYVVHGVHTAAWRNTMIHF